MELINKKEMLFQFLTYLLIGTHFAHNVDDSSTHIRLIQNENSNPLNTFRVGLNKFSNYSWIELQRCYLGLIPIQIQQRHSSQENEDNTKNMSPPTILDWRLVSNKISPVYDQGNCGSCWAFATTATVESSVAIQKKNNVVKLSEQQLLDCSSNRFGCNGGYLKKSFDYVKFFGLYPYNIYERSYCAQDNQTCISSSSMTPRIRFRSSQTRSGETFILRSLQNGVVAIGFAVAQPFMFYISGIYNGQCGTVINHAMVIVGYTPQVWIVRNSWGRDWGENGYVYIPRGQNKCQINSYVTAVYV